jgi:putative ABC transport system permease protein
MNVFTRGVRNAFRNAIRTGSLVVILGLSIGLALVMLVARQAVETKIQSVKSSVGNTVSISPAGVRGFDGGGNPLTQTELATVKTIAHVTAVNESLNDRLTTTTTNLVSAIDAGSLGQRFAGNSGNSTGGGGFGGPSTTDSTGTGGTTTRTFTPPVTVIGTTTPTDLSSTQGGGTFKLTSGTVFDGNSSANVAVLGTTLATKNNLKVGSTFTAYGTTVTVVGIFDGGNTFTNSQLIMPLTTIQTLSSQVGDITSATVTIDDVSNVSSATTAITKALGSAADVTNSEQAAQTAIQPLENIKTISLYSLVGAVIAGAVIILLTMIMIVRERRREIGVLKAIGGSNVKVIGQFMVEAITLTVLGAVVGIIIGVAAAQPITKVLVTNSVNSSTSSTTAGGPGGSAGGGFNRAGGANSGSGTTRQFTRAGSGIGGVRSNISNIHAEVGWTIILDGLGAAILIALVGAGAASGIIAKVRPAEVLRAE